MSTVPVLERAETAPRASQTAEKKIFTLHAHCETCREFFPADELGSINDRAICDKCFESNIPPKYCAELFTITQAADELCLKMMGLTLLDVVEIGLLIMIEDEFGDLVYTSLNMAALLVDVPVPGNTAIYHMPQEMRMAHRRTQRESLQSLQHRCYLGTVGERHWTVKINPFEVTGDRFTLTLFHDISS